MSNLLPRSNSNRLDSATALPLQFLKFMLCPGTKAMLPIKQITEILNIQPTQIMPIPQMPAWVMGVYNWRGEILWAIDLPQLLGLDSCYRHQHERSKHTAIVLSPDREGENKIHLGSIVSEVDGLEYCDPTAIQSSMDDSHLSSFSQGYWLEPSGEMVLALEGKAIAAAMPSHRH